MRKRVREPGFYGLYGALYTRAYWTSFFLTLLLFPFFLIVSSGAETGGGSGGFLLVFLYLGGIFMGAVVLVPSSLIAGVSFPVLIYVGRRVLPAGFVYVVATAVSVFLACYIGFQVKIAFSPFEIRLDEKKETFAGMVGMFAALVASLVAIVQWLSRREEVLILQAKAKRKQGRIGTETSSQ